MIGIFLALAAEFFKTGLFAVGGGLATLPFLYEIADKYSWLEKSRLPDMIAVSESTPGPIGVNMATYSGYSALSGADSILLGILGGVTATLFLVLPSLLVCIIVYKFLEKFKESPLVKSAFTGLRPAVCGLIAAAFVTVFKSACLNTELFEYTKVLTDIFDIKALILFPLLLIAVLKTNFHPAFYIIPSAVIGIILKMS